MSPLKPIFFCDVGEPTVVVRADLDAPLADAVAAYAAKKGWSNHPDAVSHVSAQDEGACAFVCSRVPSTGKRAGGEGGPRRVTQAELREVFDHPPFRVLGIDAAEMGSLVGGGGRKSWLARIERLDDPQE